VDELRALVGRELVRTVIWIAIAMGVAIGVSSFIKF
jgi:hypothetical protein